MTWLTTDPPIDGSSFLADVGLPFAVVASWNVCDCCFVYASLNCNMVNGVYNDFYFENEYEKPNGVKRWMPLPELPPT
jgi:hypothetical protein